MVENNKKPPRFPEADCLIFKISASHPAMAYMRYAQGRRDCFATQKPGGSQDLRELKNQSGSGQPSKKPCLRRAFYWVAPPRIELGTHVFSYIMIILHSIMMIEF
jgi:hypothetical protein